METNNPDFIRWITAWMPSGATIIACIMILFGKAKDYQSNVKNTNEKDEKFDIIEDFVE